MDTRTAWTSEDDEILIDFVKKNQVLYNVKNSEFRNFSLKQSLWHKIGTTLEKTGTDCWKRWSYVRDFYIRRKRNPCTGTEKEATKKRCNLLSFLDTIPQYKKNTANKIRVFPFIDIEQKNQAKNVPKNLINDSDKKHAESNSDDVFKHESKKRKLSEEPLQITEETAEQSASPSEKKDIIKIIEIDAVTQNDVAENLKENAEEPLHIMEEAAQKSETPADKNDIIENIIEIDAITENDFAENINENAVEAFQIVEEIPDDERNYTIKIIKIGTVIKSGIPEKKKENAAEPLQTIEERAQRTAIRFDETDLFFLSMAQIVKRMSYYEQIKYKTQFSSMLGDDEVKRTSADLKNKFFYNI